jgi:maleylpyruvate isomerase
MKLYGYWRSSSSWRVRIALEIKARPWQYAAVHLLEGEQNKSEHAGRNPMQQVPVLELEEQGELVRIGQSLAIIEFLEERFPEPPLLPADRVQRARARQLAEIVNSGIQPLQNLALLAHLKAVAPAVHRKAFPAHFIARGLGAMEAIAAHTAGRYLVGDQVTIADVCLVPQLYSARRFDVELEAFSTLLAIERRLNELEPFQRAHPDRQPDARVGDK